MHIGLLFHINAYGSVFCINIIIKQFSVNYIMFQKNLIQSSLEIPTLKLLYNKSVVWQNLFKKML